MRFNATTYDSSFRKFGTINNIFHTTRNVNILSSPHVSMSQGAPLRSVASK